MDKMARANDTLHSGGKTYRYLWIISDSMTPPHVRNCSILQMRAATANLTPRVYLPRRLYGSKPVKFAISISVPEEAVS